MRAKQMGHVHGSRVERASLRLALWQLRAVLSGESASGRHVRTHRTRQTSSLAVDPRERLYILKVFQVIEI